MISQPDQAIKPDDLGLAERRLFLTLSLTERRRRLAEQANRLAEHYADKSQQAERQEWQAGEIVE